MFAAVIIQGVLGGLRVVLDVHGWGMEFGIFHGVLAQLFFLFVCSLALITSGKWARMERTEFRNEIGTRLRTFLLVATALVFVQLLLGATMRHQHQGLAVPDFPLAYGKIWPLTDGASVAGYNARRMEAAGEHPITSFHIVIHMLHRLNGFAVLFAILGCSVAVWRQTKAGSFLRKLSAAWCVAACLQVALGILTILSQRKVDVTTGHVALGAVTFMLGWFLLLMIARATAPRTVRAAAAAAVLAGGELKHA
jgi:cytochrome c oxidase assembly protein subunit 15